MSLAGISFSGLASGLDSKAIISALMAVERRPIQALQAKKQTFQKQKNLFNTLEGLLEKLRDKADAVRKSTNFLDFKAEVDSDKYFTATASNGATVGSFNVNVSQLARAEVSSSNGKADKDTTTYGTGTLQITIDGTTYDITIDSTNNTLDGIATAINAKGIDVQAQVLDTGAATNPYQLVLTSKKTGTQYAFSVAAKAGSSAALANLATEIDGNERSAAQDAQLTVNGITVTRSSNTITDVVSGVTLELKGTHPTANDTTKVTVSTDASATAAKIKEFVDAYNEIVDFAEGQSQVDENGRTDKPLFGDTTLRSIRSTLRSILGTSVDTGNQSYALLSQVGIEADTKGKLTFTQSDFEKALAADEDAVRDLFTKASAGIAVKIYDQADSYVDSVDGVIKARLDSFDDRIRDTDRQIERAERRLDRLEESLTARFAALETLMARLQTQGSALNAANFGGPR